MLLYQKKGVTDEVMQKVEGGLQALADNIQPGLQAIGWAAVVGWDHLRYQFWTALGEKSKATAQQDEEVELGDTLSVSDLAAPPFQHYEI